MPTTATAAVEHVKSTMPHGENTSRSRQRRRQRLRVALGVSTCICACACFLPFTVIVSVTALVPSATKHAAFTSMHLNYQADTSLMRPDDIHAATAATVHNSSMLSTTSFQPSTAPDSPRATSATATATPRPLEANGKTQHRPSRPFVANSESAASRDASSSVGSSFHATNDRRGSSRFGKVPSTPRTKRRKRKRWDTMIVRLEEYHAKHGHSMVSKLEDVKLYQWSQTIRKNYSHQIRYPDTELPNRPRLAQEDLRRLAKLDFCWNLSTASWDKQYERLRKYQAKHGHCEVSHSDDAQLSIFVQNQRQEFRRIKQYGEACYRSSLTPERIERLNKLNFVWPRPQNVAWEQRYEELVEFANEFGHSDVPQEYAANPGLGRWCMNQRSKYRQWQQGQHTSMTPKRIERLEAIGFSWHIREAKWQSMFRRLKQYHEQRGHTEISPADDANNDLRLWLIWQRFLYNSLQRDASTYYVLPQSRIEQLEKAIPNFSWKGRDSDGPSKEDWSKLFVAIQEKGIKPGMRPKQHWFEGLRRNEMDVKSEYTEDELVALWNSGDEEEDDDDDDVDVGVGDIDYDDADLHELQV